MIREADANRVRAVEVLKVMVLNECGLFRLKTLPVLPHIVES